MAKTYLGVDIGGTNTRIVLLRGLSPQKVRMILFPTPRNRKKLEQALFSRMRGLVEGKRLSGIGVAIAGIVNRVSGKVGTAENLPYLKGWNPKEFLRRKFRVPVEVENDARSFLLAESRWGAARGKRHVAGVVIGTGIGGGIMVDGKIWRGAHGSAGEVGDILLDWGKTFEQSAAKKAYEARGDRSKEIGRGIASIITMLDPEIVILGGGGVASGKVRLAIVRKMAKRFAGSPEIKNTPIVFGKLGDSAQAIGAVLLLGRA